jgi:predicted DNA-binding transcriptional regulator
MNSKNVLEPPYDITKTSKDSSLIYEVVAEKMNDVINDIAKEFGIHNNKVSYKLDMEYRGVYKLLVECIYKELVENNKVNDQSEKS